MAQTTNSVPLACGKLEIAVDAACSIWYDISGEDQSVSGTEQARKSGEAYTLDGDTALIAGGKREPLELTFAIAYTEIATEAYERIRAQFETACGGPVCVRWSPKGGNVGDEQLTSAAGVVTGFTYPPMDASGGGVILAGFKLKVPSVGTTVVTS